jgi:hypothetical protein
MYVFLVYLFNDDVSNSDDTAPNCWIPVNNKLESMWRGLIEKLPRHFPGSTGKTKNNSSNTSQQRYFLSFRLCMYVTSVREYVYEYIR